MRLEDIEGITAEEINLIRLACKLMNAQKLWIHEKKNIDKVVKCDKITTKGG